MNNWHGGASIGALYRVMDEADCQRVGNCWMKGRLKVGDYVLCLAHSGDAFFDYMLVEKYANGWQGIPKATFGAYYLGEALPDTALSSREYHLLAAGEFVKRAEWLETVAS